MASSIPLSMSSVQLSAPGTGGVRGGGGGSGGGLAGDGGEGGGLSGTGGGGNGGGMSSQKD
eukprot:scaffold283038_cov29-Prasinocladus_malaysianus.AAC.1